MQSDLCLFNPDLLNKKKKKKRSNKKTTDRIEMYDLIVVRIRTQIAHR